MGHRLSLLHGKIDHDIFFKLPEGYEEPGKVGKLNKALYGCPKQHGSGAKISKPNSNHWDSHLWEATRSIPEQISNWIYSHRYPCDDGTGICSSEEEESRIKSGIQKFYKIKEKDTSKPFKVLGILVTRDTHWGTLK